MFTLVVPIALAALLRAAGSAAAGAAGRAAASAAGRAGAGAAGRSAAGMAGRAGGQMAFGQGVRGLLSMLRTGGDKNEPPAFSEMEAARQSFLERMQRGEEITDDELADAPAGYVPDELMGRRTSAQFSRMVAASMSSGGASGVGGSGSPPAVQPGGGFSAPPPPMPPTGPGLTPPPPPGSGAGGSGAAAVLNTAGAAVGGFVGAIVKATAATVAAVKGLEAMNSGVIALNRGLADYEGNLAAAYAQFDIDEFQRGVRRSETMSGPLQSLLKEQSELRDSTSEVGNEISAGFAQLLSAVTGAANYINRVTGATDAIAESVRSIREAIFGAIDDSAVALPLQLFFADVSDGKFDGKRPDFGKPKDIFPKQP